MQRTIFHIDVNSAFLSWSALEELKNGSSVDLRLIPSIIGGNQQNRHGVVLAKSIPAKRFHINTGEPVSAALKKCPDLVIAPPDHHLYEQYSHCFMELLRNYTPDIEQVSIDECFLDFTPIAHQFSSPYEAAIMIKDHIYKTLGFTVNIGISSNKLLAKMASDFQKPNLVHTLFPEEIQQKMWPLPVSELYMAGKSSVETLMKLEILTIGDLALADPALLKAHLKSHGKLLWEYANGIDESPLLSIPAELKGVGNSTTLSQDVTDGALAKKTLLALSEQVSSRLRKKNQLAGMVSIEIKYHDFVKVSHQKQCLTPTASTASIYQNACELFDELWNLAPIRLLGIRTSKLTSVNEPLQMNLFDYENGISSSPKQALSSDRQDRLDKTMDAIRNRFGKTAVVRGSFYKKKESPNSDSENSDD